MGLEFRTERFRHIRTATERLIEMGLTEGGNYNKNGHDRKIWNALGNEGKKRQMDLSNLTNGSGRNDKPIPDNIPDTKEKEINKEKESEGKSYFIPPTVEEVKAYCTEQGYTIDPEQFVDFYTAKNWFIGKTKMKDWKAAVRTWTRGKNQSPPPQPQPSHEYTKGKVREGDDFF